MKIVNGLLYCQETSMLRFTNLELADGDDHLQYSAKLIDKLMIARCAPSLIFENLDQVFKDSDAEFYVDRVFQSLG